MKDWNNDPGWACLKFAMDRPMSFQYRVDVDGQSVNITAHGRHTFGGHVIDATFGLQALVVEDGLMNIAPNIAETWKTL